MEVQRTEQAAVEDEKHGGFYWQVTNTQTKRITWNKLQAFMLIA